MYFIIIDIIGDGVLVLDLFPLF